MKYLVLAVRDRSAECFGQPIFAVSRGGAIRSFGDEVNRASDNNMYNKHPEDFDLFELGTFDDSTGMFDVGVPQQIAVGKNLVR